MNEEELRENGYVLISDFFKELQPWYWIDNTGKIYSTKTNTFLKPQPDKDGYLRQCLRMVKPTVNNYYTKLCGVHKIVNTIFNGYPPITMNNPVTDHLDGDKLNNYYENLRWLSNEYNASYANRHNGKKSEIKDHDVPTIYRLFDEGKSLQEIADKFHSKWKYIHGILTGQKRVVAIEKFHLQPLESTKNVLTTKRIKRIAYEILTTNKTNREIGNIFGICGYNVADVRQKSAHGKKTQYYNFKNKQILYDPDNFINSYDEFIQMDDYYNQFIYETENNEEFDMFADDSQEITIGETEYYTDTSF